MDTWSLFAENRHPTHYTSGQIIYLQGTEAHRFYYILQGSVKCFITSETGDERTLTLHHTGELIGEAAFFDGQPRVSSAMAISPCALVPVDRTQLRQIFAQHPELAMSMLEYLARTVRLLSAHVDSAFLQADRRVARHLLSLTADANNTLHCTHEELGSAVGASRVTVSRVLAQLEAQGLLSRGYRTLRLLDREALASYAQTGL